MRRATALVIACAIGLIPGRELRAQSDDSLYCWKDPVIAQALLNYFRRVVTDHDSAAVARRMRINVPATVADSVRLITDGPTCKGLATAQARLIADDDTASARSYVLVVGIGSARFAVFDPVDSPEHWRIFLYDATQKYLMTLID